MVTVDRADSTDGRSRIYSLPDPGIEGISRVRIIVDTDTSRRWNALEGQIMAAIGCILGPNHADKAVLAP